MFNPDKVKYYTDNKRVVVATCRWMGHIIRAEALCHPNDIFDYETGKKLATARLMGHAQIMLRDRVSDELDVLSAHINFLMDERNYLEEKYHAAVKELRQIGSEINRLLGR